MAKPDSHLELVLANAMAGERDLVLALLGVDLGARINVDMAKQRIFIEGRFWKDDVVSAIELVGGHVASVNERPRSVRLRA